MNSNNENEEKVLVKMFHIEFKTTLDYIYKSELLKSLLQNENSEEYKLLKEKNLVVIEPFIVDKEDKQAIETLRTLFDPHALNNCIYDTRLFRISANCISFLEISHLYSYIAKEGLKSDVLMYEIMYLFLNKLKMEDYHRLVFKLCKFILKKELSLPSDVEYSIINNLQYCILPFIEEIVEQKGEIPQKCINSIIKIIKVSFHHLLWSENDYLCFDYSICTSHHYIEDGYNMFFYYEDEDLNVLGWGYIVNNKLQYIITKNTFVDESYLDCLYYLPTYDIGKKTKIFIETNLEKFSKECKINYYELNNKDIIEKCRKITF